MKPLEASDSVVKFRVERDNRGYYYLYINGCYIMYLAEYAQIVSKSKPSTYDQVLIGEVLELLGDASGVYGTQLPRPSFLSEIVYNDLRSTFKRSRKAGEAKALALAKKLYLDDFNHMVQTSTWVKITNGTSRVLGIKLSKVKRGDNCYSLRFSDGVDSITVKSYPFAFEYFPIFWYFKTKKFKEMISVLLHNGYAEVSSSIRGVEKKTLLKALELALRYNTTLGAALFLTARE